MPNKLVTRRWTTERWEVHIGEQVRRARSEEAWTQAELARRANVNRNSVSTLERGDGSSLATLIRVVRALGRTDWLDALAPDLGPSPMALLKEQQQARQQSRRQGTTQQSASTTGAATSAGTATSAPTTATATSADAGTATSADASASTDTDTETSAAPTSTGEE